MAVERFCYLDSRRTDGTRTTCVCAHGSVASVLAGQRDIDLCYDRHLLGICDSDMLPPVPLNGSVQIAVLPAAQDLFDDLDIGRASLKLISEYCTFVHSPLIRLVWTRDTQINRGEDE